MHTWFKKILLLALSGLLCFSSLMPDQVGKAQGGPGTSPTYTLSLPLTFNSYPVATYRLNIPRFGGAIPANESSVIWFGQVTPTLNYVDARVGYNDEELFVYTAVVDRHLWYPKNPSPAEFDRWDSVSVYLNFGKGAYRLDAVLAPEEPGIDRSDYQAAHRLEQDGWQKVDLGYRTKTGWRGTSLNSENGKEMGWLAYYHIPFSGLGLSGPPDKGQVWRFAVEVNDRDDPSGTPIPAQSWPPDMNRRDASRWAELNFGMPGSSTPGTPSGRTVVRHGFEGQQVDDKGVGGTTTCGKLTDTTGNGRILDFWKEWGSYAYSDPLYKEYDLYLNVQNEAEVADFPCFSKVYFSFPLEKVPRGKQIISATLTLHQFGNSGGGDWGQGPKSLVQVFTLNSGWDPNTLSWNNAPVPRENVSRSWVDWLADYPGWPGVPRQWDVTRAVEEAYGAGEDLNLALYSGDEALHSGKYFYSSEQGSAARPQLEIVWGE